MKERLNDPAVIEALPLLNWTWLQWSAADARAGIWYVGESPPLHTINLNDPAGDDETYMLECNWDDEDGAHSHEHTYQEVRQARLHADSGVIYVPSGGSSKTEWVPWYPLLTVPLL